MDELFDLPPRDPEPHEAGRARPRLQRPDRAQITLRPTDLESLLPPDHRARLVWAFVEGLDLSAFHARIRAVEGHSGRPPIAPPSIPPSSWRSGCMPRSRGWAARGRSIGCAPSTTPTAGSAALWG